MSSSEAASFVASGTASKGFVGVKWTRGLCGVPAKLISLVLFGLGPGCLFAEPFSSPGESGGESLLGLNSFAGVNFACLGALRVSPADAGTWLSGSKGLSGSKQSSGDPGGESRPGDQESPRGRRRTPRAADPRS